MPTITDWLMVGITFIYALVTILILIQNSKSAKATKEQVEESKRQYEETKRLDIMPYLQLKITDRVAFPDTNLELDILDEDPGDGVFKDWCISGCELRNIGRGTAKDIDCASSGCAIINMGVKFRTTALQSGSMQTMNIILSATHTIDNLPEVKLYIYYRDLLEHTYKQVVELDIVKRAESEEFLVLNCTTHSPELLLDE